jgi:RimJ/RimL family protein N-acetyltransferase
MAIHLARWSEEHLDRFCKMQSDPEVMADLDGPFDRRASEAKFARYREAWAADGISRWAVLDNDGIFLGYAGVMKRDDADHPLGSHYEVGWRFRREAWGNGFATESARRALSHAWTVLDVSEIYAYTSADNRRSQRVMMRLDLRRDAARDFTARHPKGEWTGLVWIATRPRGL